MVLSKSSNHTIKVDNTTTPVQVEEFLQKLSDESHLRGNPLSHDGSVLLYTLGNELVHKPVSTDERMEHMAAARVAISVVFDPLNRHAEIPGVAEALRNIHTIMHRTRDAARVHDLRSPVTVLADAHKVLYQKHPVPAGVAGEEAGHTQSSSPTGTLAPALRALAARTDRPTPQQKKVFENLLGILLSRPRNDGQ